jgi:hypothetical protein
MRGNSNCYVRKLNVLDCATIVSHFVVLLPGPHHNHSLKNIKEHDGQFNEDAVHKVERERIIQTQNDKFNES